MSSRIKISIAAVVVVVALAGAGLWWFFGDDAPAAVSLEAAVAQVDGATDGDTAPDTGDGIAGTWTVDTQTGDFDYDSATGTFVGFRIEEELASIGSTEAVGRTGEVTGSITIDGTVLTEASFVADLTDITTNESRRDDKVQSALETEDHPSATFVLSDSVDLGDAAESGEPVALTVTGELTIHGVTRTVEVSIEAQLVDDTIVVIGSTDITFSDYDVEVPESQAVLSVDDHGTVEFQLLLTRS